MMKQGTSHVDTGSYREFENQLKVSKLKLGYCKYDEHCLFRTLYQLLHDVKDSEEDMEAEVGGGSSDTGVTDRKKMLKLRRSIVRIVLEKHQTEEQLQIFQKCWKESVGDWARRMQEQEDYGDTVCIEYFARHFRVTIRVYTPVCQDPLQFPMYLEQQEEIVVGNIKSVYRIAHVPLKSGEEVRPNYYVPVWAGGVSFTPHSTPPHTYEPSIEERQWKKKAFFKYSTGDAPMASTSARLAPDKANREATAGTRMTAAATEEDRAMLRQKQAAEKLLCKKQAGKKLFDQKNNQRPMFWESVRPKANQKEYYLHKESKKLVLPEDFVDVCDDTHPTVKIPDGMQK